MIQEHLVSVLRALGKFPFDILIHHLASRSGASSASLHPLAFIRPMIHEKDPNVLYTLLSGLRSLPAAIWAGTAPATSNNGLIGKSRELAETLEPLQSNLNPATPLTSDDPFHDIFGPFEGASTSHSPEYITPSESLGLSNVSTSPKAVPNIPHLPPLFEEDEVGIIIGLLRSEDSTLRKDVRVGSFAQLVSITDLNFRRCVFFSASTQQNAELPASTSARSWKELRKSLRSRLGLESPPTGNCRYSPPGHWRLLMYSRLEMGQPTLLK
jgi:hypothetical protein